MSDSTIREDWGPCGDNEIYIYIYGYQTPEKIDGIRARQKKHH